MIPSTLVFVILSLAAFRVTRLLGWDDLPPIVRLRARVTGETMHHNSTTQRDGPIIRHRRPVLAHFLACPYCSGFWVCLLVYVLWLVVPTEVQYAAVPFALSGLVGITARMLDP